MTARATVTSIVTGDRDNAHNHAANVVLFPGVTDLDRYAGGADSKTSTHAAAFPLGQAGRVHDSAPPPSGPRLRPYRPKVVPDLARADEAIALLASWAAVVTVWRLSLTFPAATALDDVRAALARLVDALGNLGSGRGGWGAVDVRADGEGPHLYALAVGTRSEIAPLFAAAVQLLGGAPECQRLDPVTAWDQHAAGCDAAGRVRPELGRAFAYGAKPWAVGERAPLLDVAASGVLAPLGLSRSTAQAPSVTPARLCPARRRDGTPCGRCLDGSNDHRKTCSDACRQALSRSRRRAPHRDTADHVAARLGLTCRECFAADDEPCGCLGVGAALMARTPRPVSSSEGAPARGLPGACPSGTGAPSLDAPSTAAAAPATPEPPDACSARGRAAGAAPPADGDDTNTLDPASRGPGGLGTGIGHQACVSRGRATPRHRKEHAMRSTKNEQTTTDYRWENGRPVDHPVMGKQGGPYKPRAKQQHQPRDESKQPRPFEVRK